MPGRKLKTVERVQTGIRIEKARSESSQGECLNISLGDLVEAIVLAKRFRWENAV
jgi:hypothetical protein